MDFSKQLQKADEAMRRRNPDFAAELYRQLLDIQPDLGEARAGLRRAQLKRAERKKRGVFGKVGGAVPLGRAKAALKLRKFEAAAKALEDYLATNPADEEGNLLLGEALEAAGHERSALAVYAFLAEVAPKNAEGLKRAGMLARRRGEFEDALGYLERALAVDPRDQEAIKARQDLSAETALSKGALDTAGHSREVVKDQAETQRLERQARRRRSPEELKEEVARLEDALLDDPGNPDKLLDVGALYVELRDWPAALEFHQRALEYRRNDFDLACQVGDLEARVLRKQIAQADKAGDRATADRLEGELLVLEVADHQRRVEKRPGDMGLRLALGKALARSGEHDAALGELQKVAQDLRHGPEARFHLAKSFQDKGILDLARKQYEEALESCRSIDDRAKEILYNLGLISEDQGDPERAREAWIRIYEVDIAYRDVAARMERLS